MCMYSLIIILYLINTIANKNRKLVGKILYLRRHQKCIMLSISTKIKFEYFFHLIWISAQFLIPVVLINDRSHIGASIARHEAWSIELPKILLVRDEQHVFCTSLQSFIHPALKNVKTLSRQFLSTPIRNKQKTQPRV